MQVEIRDPVRSFYPATPWTRALANRVLIDDRNYPFLRLVLEISLVLVPSAIIMYAAPFRWWHGAAHLFVVLFVFLDRYILMVHNISHAPAFAKGFRWIAEYIDWVVGPLHGHTPRTYFAHHIGMHHLEGNAPEDASSTERFQRDSIFHFARYLFRFYFWCVVDVSRYMARHGRTKLIRQMLTGEIGYYIVVAILLTFAPLPTLFVFVLPLAVTRFLMMAGNWGQHAFVDPADPDSSYKNSITCINSRYNRRAFNDGYHIGHHLFPRMHWTELPQELDAHRETYAKEGAFVFEGIDFFIVWGALMLKQYGFLARRFVTLGGERPTDDEIVKTLRARLVPIPRAIAP
jgi:fatty acid desaturase